nr:response regulator transcription factor [uncultured Dyadobacter sp.]
MPKPEFSECYRLDKFLSSNSEANSFYILLWAGNTSDKIIINNIRALKYSGKPCKIILYGYKQPIQYILQFLKEKIDAYLPEDFGENDLKECLTSIAAGRIYVDTQIVIELLSIRTKRQELKSGALTPTEVRVANLLVSGLSQSLIAREMHRNTSTISNIKSNIFKKTNVTNITDLAGAMGNSITGIRI